MVGLKVFSFYFATLTSTNNLCSVFLYILLTVATVTSINKRRLTFSSSVKQEIKIL